MNLVPDAGPNPVAHPSPARGVGRELGGQIVPTDDVTRDVGDDAEALPIAHQRSAALGLRPVLGDDLPDAFPKCFRQLKFS